jgi:hypothetical protein
MEMEIFQKAVFPHTPHAPSFFSNFPATEGEGVEWHDGSPPFKKNLSPAWRVSKKCFFFVMLCFVVLSSACVLCFVFLREKQSRV